jgi:hypothetical protein
VIRADDGESEPELSQQSQDDDLEEASQESIELVSRESPTSQSQRLGGADTPHVRDPPSEERPVWDSSYDYPLPSEGRLSERRHALPPRSLLQPQEPANPFVMAAPPAHPYEEGMAELKEAFEASRREGAPTYQASSFRPVSASSLSVDSNIEFPPLGARSSDPDSRR